jgi:hypothetical protein
MNYLELGTGKINCSNMNEELRNALIGYYTDRAHWAHEMSEKSKSEESLFKFYTFIENGYLQELKILRAI